MHIYIRAVTPIRRCVLILQTKNNSRDHNNIVLLALSRIHNIAVLRTQRYFAPAVIGVYYYYKLYTTVGCFKSSVSKCHEIVKYFMRRFIMNK